MRYDAIIVGTGQAGPPLARRLADRGWKVAVAEGGLFGGSCVNHGCTPSKAMIGSANAIQAARRGAEFGFDAGEVVVDYHRLTQRRDIIVKNSRDALVKSLERRENITIYRYYASFEAPKRLRVGDDVIESDKIFLNVGTRAFIPPIKGLDYTPYLDNTRLMELRKLPEHLVIIGGGYIGLEFAQAYRRYGSAITVIEDDDYILDSEDHDFSEAVRCVLELEGIHFVMGGKAAQVEGKSGKISVQVEHKDGTTELVSGSHLLIATGRRPNGDGIGADKAGLELDERHHIKVDDHLRTNIDGVYALGDVNGKGAFTHTAYNDFEIVLANLDGEDRKVSDRIMTYAAFTDPPLAHVGMNERDVRASGRKALMATMPMDRVNRAKEFGQTEGFMKVLVDAESKQFLGATLFGMSADEAIQSITALMYAKAPYTVMTHSMMIYPTVTELLPSLLQRLKPLE